MPDLELVVLGTGTPLPSANRCGAGHVVIGGGATVLIDCGWGAARRLLASGVPIGDVSHVFFTHMHSDHITDFPDFLMMRWTAGNATTPVTVYGPEGTREAMEGFRTALNPDVRYRLAHHGEKLDPAGMDVTIKEVPATQDVAWIAEVGGLHVGSFEVDHRPVEPALGFKVQAGSTAITFSGDTRRCDAFVNASKGATAMISEAVHLGMMEQNIARLRAAGQHRIAEIMVEACDYHAPTLQVAEMARDAAVKQLILAHVIPSTIPDEGPVVDQFVAGMSDIYKGPLIVARDLQRFQFGP